MPLSTILQLYRGCKFYWWGKPDIKNVQIYRFCRVPFGIISSPFLLAAMIDLHLQKYRNPVAEKIRDNIYVDKLLTGADTKDKLKELYHESKDIF